MKLWTRMKRNMRDVLRTLTSTQTRRKLAFALVSARRPTGRWRPLPDVLVIGAQRCGTSSLFKYLGAHPLAIPSIRKEIRFFTEFYDRGPNWYRSHFPLAMPYRNGDRGLVRFEATPDYLLDPRAARRAAEVLPGVRAVVLLRDPVKRAYSHYWHNRRLGTESVSFEEALRREKERIAPALRELASGSEGPASKALLRYSYVERGRYAGQIERWLERLADPDHMLVLRSEDLFNETDDSFQRLLAFLGLPEWRPAQYQNFSYASERPKYPPMSADTRDRLIETFRPEVERLQAMGLDARLFEDWTCASR